VCAAGAHSAVPRACCAQVTARVPNRTANQVRAAWEQLEAKGKVCAAAGQPHVA